MYRTTAGRRHDRSAGRTAATGMHGTARTKGSCTCAPARAVLPSSACPHASTCLRHAWRLAHQQAQLELRPQRQPPHRHRAVRERCCSSCCQRRRREVDVPDGIIKSIFSLLLDRCKRQCSFSRSGKELRAARLVRREALVLVLLAALLAAHVEVTVHAAKQQAQRAHDLSVVHATRRP